jgi:Spy/CpxP family protein refolding chaperone
MQKKSILVLLVLLIALALVTTSVCVAQRDRGGHGWHQGHGWDHGHGGHHGGNWGSSLELGGKSHQI